MRQKENIVICLPLPGRSWEGYNSVMDGKGEFRLRRRLPELSSAIVGVPCSFPPTPQAIFPVFRMKRAAINIPMTTRIIAQKAQAIPWLIAVSAIPLTHCA
jgi:hypothetical protein